MKQWATKTSLYFSFHLPSLPAGRDKRVRSEGVIKIRERMLVPGLSSPLYHLLSPFLKGDTGGFYLAVYLK
jgi:hypothetical protein